MTQWRFQTAATNTVPSGVTEYGFLLGLDSSSTIESINELKMYVAYTFSNIRANVTALDGGDSTFALRDDGVTSSNQTIPISATGWQEDVTGSDAIDADSLMNYILIENNGMHDNLVTITDTMITYEHASTDAPKIGSGIGNTVSTIFLAPGGNGRIVEAEADLLIKRSQTASNLTTNVTVTSGTWDLYLRINQVDSSNLQITTLVTGQNEDVTGTEAYADGDDLNFRFFEAAGGALRARVFGVDLNTPESWWGTISNSFTTREYQGFNGDAGNTSADDNFDARIGSVSAGNLQTYVTDAGSGTRDVKLRVASTDSTNLNIAITATGLAEDVTGSQAVADTDNVTASMASTSGAVTVSRVAVELPFSAAGGISIPVVYHHRQRNF